MPNTRIRDQWEPWVKSIVAEHEKWGPRRILGELRNRAETAGLSKDYPSERTIQRIKDGITPEEIIEYRSFYWPESMERGDLPWEASESALELLGFLDSRGGGLRQRPPIRFVRWFWRVSQAGPGPGIKGRYEAAVALTIDELGGKRVLARGAEWWLAYRPWDGATHRESYREAVRRAENPIPELDGGYTWSIPGSANEAEVRAWVMWMFSQPPILGGRDIQREVRENG